MGRGDGTLPHRFAQAVSYSAGSLRTAPHGKDRLARLGPCRRSRQGRGAVRSRPARQRATFDSDRSAGDRHTLFVDDVAAEDSAELELELHLSAPARRDRQDGARRGKARGSRDDLVLAIGCQRRELEAVAKGQPIKRWVRTPGIVAASGLS